MDIAPCAPSPYPLTTTTTTHRSAPLTGLPIQNAVFAELGGLWNIGHNIASPQDDKVRAESIELGRTTIVYAFIDEEPLAGSKAADRLNAKKSAVEETIKTWQEHANVLFLPESDSNAGADIRISFCSPFGSSWSVVGAVNRGGPTLNLGQLHASRKPNALDRATILHEFGHVLGMMHEHQSPARGGTITLIASKVYDYYRPFLHNDQAVREQVLDVYDKFQSNFSEFDRHSIMMYAMPAHLNHQGTKISPNQELSKLDKAFIALAYPHKDSSILLKAMATIGVPNQIAIDIIKPLENVDGLRGPDLIIRLNDVREAFFTYNKKKMAATDPSVGSQKAQQGRPRAQFAWSYS